MDNTTFRVWTESADLVWPNTGQDMTGDNDETSADAAAKAMTEAIREHVSEEDCHGCGVLTPQGHHGFHIQACRDDRDVTGEHDNGIPTVAEVFPRDLVTDEQVNVWMGRLSAAGLRVHWASRDDSGYLVWHDMYEQARNGTEPWVDLSRIGLSDSCDQAHTYARSNYRRLREDYPHAFTDMHTSGYSLGAFLRDLSDDLVDILRKLSDDYPVYDEDDMARLESKEIEAAFDDYLLADTRRELSDADRDLLDNPATDRKMLRTDFFAELHGRGYWPEHTGLEIVWDDAIVAEALGDAIRHQWGEYARTYLESHDQAALDECGKCGASTWKLGAHVD